MSAWMWWAIAGAVWTAVSIGLGVVIGRMAKARDTQKPVEPQPVIDPASLPKLPPQVLQALVESIRDNPPSGPRGDKQ